MKKKHQLLLLILFFICGSWSLRTGKEGAWCKVSTNPVVNIGYCVEGVDGTGKCLKNPVANAPRCSADQSPS